MRLTTQRQLWADTLFTTVQHSNTTESPASSFSAKDTHWTQSKRLMSSRHPRYTSLSLVWWSRMSRDFWNLALTPTLKTSMETRPYTWLYSCFRGRPNLKRSRWSLRNFCSLARNGLLRTKMAKQRWTFCKVIKVSCQRKISQRCGISSRSLPKVQANFYRWQGPSRKSKEHRSSRLPCWSLTLRTSYFLSWLASTNRSYNSNHSRGLF